MDIFGKTVKITSNPVGKRAKDVMRHFTTEDVWMADKDTKLCAVAQTIRETNPETSH